MKNIFTKKLTVILLLCAASSASAWAQSEYCNAVFTCNRGDAQYADEAKFKLSFNTRSSDGAVIITISPYSSLTQYAYFRGSSAFALDRITVLKDNVSQGAGTAFFTRNQREDKTCIVLTPNAAFNTLVSSGSVIKLTYANTIEYATAWTNGWYRNGDLNNLVSPNLTVSYTYGTNCSTALETPTISGIDNNRVITFNEVAGATGYRVVIRRNDNSDAVMFAQNISGSGEVLNMTIPSSSKTYLVSVMAFDNNGSFSAASSPYTWTYTNTSSVQSAATSAYCEYFYNPEPNSGADPFFTNTANLSTENDAFKITWETAKTDFAGDANYNAYQAGDFYVTLSDFGGHTAVFSGNGFHLNNIIIGGLPGNAVLTKVSTNDNLKNRVFRVRTDIGLSAIPEGTEITYFGQMTVKVNGAEVSGNFIFTMPYRYGSDCSSGQLAMPVISSITENILTFSPVDPHANNFVVKVYERGTANIVYQQTVSGSGEAILFSTVGEYDVTVTAVGTEPFTNSEESDIYEWTVLPALATPTITNIDDNGVVLFSVVENAASYLVFLYQNNGTTLINTYPFTASGGNIPVPMGGGNFKVAVQAIGDEFDYANSAVSDFYSWSVVSDLGYSSWCQRYVNSGFEEDDKEAALFTIETGLNGELIVAIDGVNGHNLNFYTDGMDVDKFSIGTQKSQNGAAYFTKDVVNSNADKQIFTLIDGQSINAGTEIWYDGVIKVKSSLPSSISSLAAVTDIFTGNTNAYTNARYRFDSYIYGTTCNSAPVIFVDNQALVFYENMPDGTNVINVTGYNLTGTVNVVVPPGYVAEPNILTPANGEVNQQVAVYWDGGFYHYRNTNYKGVGIITFDGGGVSSLNNAPRIRVLGYQMNCTEYKSYFLGDGANSWNKPVYINISLNSDSTKLLMNILPYEPTGTAVWDVAQTMIGTGATAQTTTYVKLNGNNTAVERAVTNENKTIELTFASKLQNGDVVNFRDCTPNQNIRWTISGYPLDYDNTVGSDAYKTNPYGAGSAGTNNWNNLGTFTAFTVGQLCENNAAPVIRNADAATSEIPPADITEKTETSVKVYLDILRGTNHVASVTFTDETENTEFSPLTVPFQADEKYQITGIELNKNYNFCVKITDVKGNNYGCGGDTGFQEILALISFSINEHDIVTGTSKAEQNKILIYPNPAISELKITNYKDGGIMRIFDVTGKIINIVELSNNLINVSNLNVGIYFLQIDNQVVKFVKSR